MEKISRYRDGLKLCEGDLREAVINKVNEIVEWIVVYEKVHGRPTMSKYTNTNPNPYKKSNYVHPDDRRKV